MGNKHPFSWKGIVIALLCIVAPLGAAVGYFLGTTNGSRCIVEKALREFVAPRDLAIPQVSGNLLSGLAYDDVVIYDVPRLPVPNTVEAQRVVMDISLQRGLSVDIRNTVIRLPGFEPILTYGSYASGKLDVIVYERILDVPDLLTLLSLPQDVLGERLGGTLSDIDLKITGTLHQPRVSGKLFVQLVARGDISIADSAGQFDLTLKSLGKHPNVPGTVVFEGGTLSNPRSAKVNITKAAFTFTAGDVVKTALDVEASAAVKNVRIGATLKGTFEHPDLTVTSDPAFPQDRILLMLATNKTWSETDEQLAKGVVPDSAVRDLLDYIVLGGSGSKIGEYLGIKDFSVTFNKQKKEIGITKTITEKAAATYSLEQEQTPEGRTVNKQKVGGEYEVIDNLSVGANREIPQPAEKTLTEQQNKKPEESVYIKYKKTF